MTDPTPTPKPRRRNSISSNFSTTSQFSLLSPRSNIEIPDIDQTSNNVKILQQKLMDLIIEKRKNHSRFETQKINSTAKIVSLEDQIDRANNKIFEQHQVIEDLKMKNESLSNELVNANSTGEMINRQLIAVQKEFDGLVSDHNNLIEKNQKSEEIIVLQRTTIGCLDERNKDLVKKLTELEEKNQELVSRLKEAEEKVPIPEVLHDQTTQTIKMEEELDKKPISECQTISSKTSICNKPQEVHDLLYELKQLRQDIAIDLIS